MHEEFTASPASSQTQPDEEEVDNVEVDAEPIKDELQESDPSLADWFEAGSEDTRRKKGKIVAKDESETESETEPESDNEDVREDEELLVDEKDLDDDWLKVTTSGTVSPYAWPSKILICMFYSRKKNSGP